MSIGDLGPMSVQLHSVDATSSHDALFSSASASASAPLKSTTSTKTTVNSTRRRMLKPQKTSKIRMKSKKKWGTIPQWIFIEYDKSFRTDRCYRITLQFLVCTGSTMLEFTSSLNKLCKKGNILMMQVPEYTHPWQNPYIHAFLVPLHLPMPLAEQHCLTRIVEDAMVKRYGFVLEADNEWSPATLMTTAAALSATATNSTSTTTTTTTTGEKESDLWAGKQYLHRTGGAFVRVLKDGLLWIPNRMTNTRAVWKDIQQLFVVFRSFTQTMNRCYSILMDLVENLLVQRKW